MLRKFVYTSANVSSSIWVKSQFLFIFLLQPADNLIALMTGLKWNCNLRTIIQVSSDPC